MRISYEFMDSALSLNGVQDLEFSENDDINKLYSLTSKALEISASQDIDRESKKVFGNINAIVGVVAFLRNKLGDAHGQYEKNELLLNELGELSVNLAGSICTFLIKAFEKKKDRAGSVKLS